MSYNYSLLDGPNAAKLKNQLVDAFEAYILAREPVQKGFRFQRALREESAEVYRDMWLAFADFCAPRNLYLDDLTAEDLEIFLTVRGTGAENRAAHVTTKSEQLTPRYGRRYLVLIDRVTRHEAKAAGKTANSAARELMARAEYKYANAEDKDPPPEYFNAMQSKRVIAYVTALCSEGKDGKPVTWKQVRDRTAVAVMLGAGLAPREVRMLKLPDIETDGGRKANLPWKLRVQGNGTDAPRETPLAPWAARQLQIWLDVRKNAGIPGEYVFPSTASGNQWSDTRSFEACRDVLLEAGIPPQHAHGLFRLRHTFVLRQLAGGKSEEEVAKWLGFQNVKAMSRYRNILTSPVEVI